MKGGQQARQLNAVDDPPLGDPEDYDRDERDVYTAESLGAQRKKWFVNLPLHRGVQRCQLDSGATCNVMSMKDKMRLAPRAPLQKSLARLRLYNRSISDQQRLPLHSQQLTKNGHLSSLWTRVQLTGAMQAGAMQRKSSAALRHLQGYQPEFLLELSLEGQGQAGE
ncbi:unnamed protein product [Boreogadus saida]